MPALSAFPGAGGQKHLQRRSRKNHRSHVAAIGNELQRAITYTEFDTYLAILLLIVGMIFLIDMASEAIRHRLIGLGEAR